MYLSNKTFLLPFNYEFLLIFIHVKKTFCNVESRKVILIFWIYWFSGKTDFSVDFVGGWVMNQNTVYMDYMDLFKQIQNV